MFSGFAAAIFAGVCGAADAAVQYELTSKSYVDTELAKKQDNLSAGTGIDITNNVVKSTLDLTPFATTTDMQAADQALQGKIDAEASARAQADAQIRTDFAAADTALDGKITAEASAREAADTAISNKIGTVADGKTVVDMIADAQTAATYDDTAVRGLISAEATARENADTAMAEDIADLVAADTTIRSDFAAADTALDGKITAEASAREAADTAISNKIGTVAEGKTVVDMIADAQTAATYDDTAVRGLISAEATARENADTAMAEDIADLVAADTTIRSDFAAADTALDGKITAEASAREQADAKVLTDAKKYTDDEIAELNQSLSGTSTNLGALTTRVATAEGEIDDLQAADTTIRSEFAAADKALEDAYKAADTTLDGKISTNAQAIADEATAREQADETLQGMIEDGDFVSASGILTTKGGYLVISDGFGNITLNQVAVVNGDGTTDIITGESL